MKIVLRLVFLFTFSILCTQIYGQKVVRSFKGRVVDSATQLPIKDVSVCLYRASDTSLINFCFTTPNGNFAINITNKDSLIIIFSIVGFNEKIKREPAIEHDWWFQDYRDIKLSVMPFTFQLTTARGSAIRMKGDTMEINASRFKVLPGSDVAQLFKKIPGFEVNVKGEIKVGGASVEKIMVDGSDFFGNNPGMVSKNLTADMIETVQVFEEKNEDGSPKSEQTKIINLKLKKGKRNGTFGDVLAGFGNKSSGLNTNRYESGVRLNNFKNDRKISFIANSNNINETGFDFGFDNWHRAQNDERNGTDNNYYFYSSTAGNSQGEGNINNHFQSGISYFNEFSKKRKFSFTLSADRNKYNTISASNGSNPLNDSIRRFNIDSNVLNGLAYSGSAQINYTKLRDSTLRFETGIRTSMDINNTGSNKDNIIKFNNTEIDRGVNELKNEFKNSYFRITGFLEQFMRKNKRYRYSLSSNFRNFTDDNRLYQYLKNTNDTFNNRNTQKIYRQEFLVKVFGQMPLSKYWFLNLAADRWQQTNNNSQTVNGTQQFLQRSFTNEYDRKIDTLSIKFYNRIEQYTAKPYISYYKNKFYFQAGTTLMAVDLNNKNNTSGEEISNHYIKSLPSASVSYYSEKKGYFSFGGAKTVLFPTSMDLLPVLNLSNNYQRQTGNRNLSPQETYAANLYASFNKLKGFKYLYLRSNASFSDNAKIFINEINNEGVITQKPINETGKRDLDFSLGYNKKLSKRFGQNSYISGDMGRTPSYYNKQKTFNVNSNWNYRPGFSYELSDSFEAGINVDINTQNFSNNLNEQQNYKQVTVGYDFHMRGLLKTGTEINTNVSVNDQRNVPGIGKVVTVWNLYVQQSLGKKGKFNVKLSAYDILNQNTSISRFVSDNYVYINQSNQLRQYFMISLVYKIKKMGGEEESFNYVY